MPVKRLLFFTGILVCFFSDVIAQNNHGIKKELILSALQGTTSRNDTIFLPKASKFSKVSLSDTSGYFRLVSHQLVPGKNGTVVISFNPAAGFIGIVRAKLLLGKGNKQKAQSIELTGLSTKALEGENEPPLARVLSALGYQVNIGWNKLANTVSSAMQGDEIPGGLFKKAGRGNIEMLAVARYSPDFKLSFGYYQVKDNGPDKQIVGSLAKAGSYPEHQILFPAIDSGGISFDPGMQEFGLFTQSADHAIYTSDIWNAVYHPNNVLHGARIYQAKDKQGKVIKNAYLVCFEEAKNGDYNDYVFLVKNVVAVQPPKFKTLFNGKDLSGWDSYLKGKGRNNDPEHNFRIADSTLHVNGKDVGYVITKDTFTNYHLKLDFKWGKLRWPPRENTKRDAGVCFHIGADAPDAIWMKCIEFQIQEGDVGDFWLIGKTTIERDGKTNTPGDYISMAKKRDAEKPSGQWNTIELISYNGNCVYIVNGKVVNYGKNASLKSGRILLQSEYSEVYYKNVMLQVL